MHFIRKSTYHLLSVLLFLLLIGTAWTTTAAMTFGKPDKLEGWLQQSKLYDHFVATAIEQSQKSVQNGGSSDGGGLQLSDPGVQQAVKSAVTSQVLQSSVNTILDSNYAWLSGKTAQPDFKVDLTQTKATLAANLGAYAQQRATTLPRCNTLPQSAQDVDLLSATCLPPGVTPTQAGKQVQQQIAESQDFLANPVITAQTLNQNQPAGQSSKPYYQKLSQLPTAYQLATKLPWALAALALLSAAGVILLAFERRRGVRRVGTLLIAAGIVISLLIFASGVALQRLENKVFTNASVGQLQQSLVDFASRAQHALNRVDLWFAAGFVLLGAAIYLLLRFFWPAGPATEATKPKPMEPAAATPPKPTPKKPTLIQL